MPGEKNVRGGSVNHKSLLDARTLTHLRELEAESIHMIREVAAEFDNPVMLYSVGKDSSVMARLALKAFHPGNHPFLLCMWTPLGSSKKCTRTEFVKEHGINLLTEVNQEGVDAGINPFDSGSQCIPIS